MASECEVRLLLEHARLPESESPEGGKSDAGSQVSRVPARDIYARVLLICQQTAVPGLGGGLNIGELLVRTAEAAIQQRDFDMALESADRFSCECSTRNQVRLRQPRGIMYGCSKTGTSSTCSFAPLVLLPSVVGAHSVRVARRAAGSWPTQAAEAAERDPFRHAGAPDRDGCQEAAGVRLSSLQRVRCLLADRAVAHEEVDLPVSRPFAVGDD